MGINEADTRVKLIDPAIRARGWTEELIRREVTAGAVDLLVGRPRRGRGRADYTLRVKVAPESQPVAVALIEAKAEHLPATHGLDQGKLYADAQRLNVPFVFATNGHRFVEFDVFTGLTSNQRPLADFPTPGELRARYEVGKGFVLTDPAARPLLTPYPGGEGIRRYYQDAAIRAVLERVAQGESRALLALATGAGKTFIAVNLLRRIADGGRLRRALFVCDRDELRSQAAAAFQNAFGADAAAVGGGQPEKNARVLIATYQTLGLDGDDAEATFLTTHYPPNYFSHIIVDECHRSAWGKWSQVLTRNPDAIQIGLTATPRQLVEAANGTLGAVEDAKITADNFDYFGMPVYEYDMGQGIEDGYLAACEIVRREAFFDDKADPERIAGIGRVDFVGKTVSDAITGEMLAVAEPRAHYDAGSFERRLVLPDRVEAMAADLFDHLLATGGPEQKTIVFCATDAHADDVQIALNNRYAAWCVDTGARRKDPYAFKCTAASDGNNALPDLRGSTQRHFVATTVDLLSTGVDVPNVRNIVFFRYVRSPIAFYQMVGRGTRIHAPTAKLLFRVYDYTGVTHLFGEGFVTRIGTPREHPAPPDPNGRERSYLIEGFQVRITDAGRFVVAMVDGKAMPIPVAEYKRRLAARLLAEAPTIDAFRDRWVVRDRRQELLADLTGGGLSPELVRDLDEMDDYDLYDVLAGIAYGLSPRTRPERTAAFLAAQTAWLGGLPPTAAATLRAVAEQFARAGTDELERPEIFSVPAVRQAGGLAALKALGKPVEVMHEAKERMFAA